MYPLTTSARWSLGVRPRLVALTLQTGHLSPYFGSSLPPPFLLPPAAILRSASREVTMQSRQKAWWQGRRQGERRVDWQMAQRRARPMLSSSEWTMERMRDRRSSGSSSSPVAEAAAAAGTWRARPPSERPTAAASGASWDSGSGGGVKERRGAGLPPLAPSTSGLPEFIGAAVGAAGSCV